MSEKKERPKPKGPDPHAWMVTFSDLLMLMLTFFVLLLTMSSLDSKTSPSSGQKKDGILSTQSYRLVEEEIQLIQAILPPKNPEEEHKKDLKLEVVEAPKPLKEHPEAVIAHILERHELVEQATWERRPEGILITLDEEAAFKNPTSRQLSSDTQAFLGDLAVIVMALDATLLGTTHVLDKPTQDYTGDLWELALHRADSVARVALKKRLPPQRLRVMGYGPEHPTGISKDDDGNDAPDVSRKPLQLFLITPKDTFGGQADDQHEEEEQQ